MSDAVTSNAGSGAAAYARMNALVDGGWLAVLKPLELAVWTIYHRHADAHGVAFPGPELLMNGVGHKDMRHIGAARESLVNRGLMVRMNQAGRGARMHLPTPPKRQPPPTELVGGDQNGRGGPNRSPTPDGFGPPPPTDSVGGPPTNSVGQKYPIKDPSKQPTEHPTAGAAGPGPKSNGLDGYPVELRTREFLEQWGVWLEHLEAKRRKPTRQQVDAQLAELAAVGPVAAIARLRTSISAGLYWLAEKGGSNGTVQSGRAGKSAHRSENLRV